MPLKHSEETAYMLVLGLAICLAGFAAALLPPIPVGTKYWAILLTVAVLYPLLLTRTFRTNRADYEFRALHWFPACIFVLWFMLQLIAPRIEIVRILNLGFFFLWSLPLVALGITFIIIFAIHVLRRSRLRVTMLSIVLALFAAGAVYGHMAHLNTKLQAAMYPKQAPSLASLQTAFKNLRASLGMERSSSGELVAVHDSSSSVAGIMKSSHGKILSSSSRSSKTSSRTSSSVIAMISSSSSSRMSSSYSSSIVSTSSSVHSLPPVIGDKNPGRLAQSGPEDVAVLGLTLLAGYFGLLHARARKRV